MVTTSFKASGGELSNQHQQSGTTKMHLEISIALNYLLQNLYNKLPRRRVNLFGEELHSQLKQKYVNHWYPGNPLKGSAYRSLKTPTDPIIKSAALKANVPYEDVYDNLPVDLVLWIDPGEVSYRLGSGPVKVLWTGGDPFAVEESDEEWNQGRLMTTAAFAQTKFGSTKLKSSKTKRQMSPTEFSNYIKTKGQQQQQQIHMGHIPRPRSLSPGDYEVYTPLFDPSNVWGSELVVS